MQLILSDDSLPRRCRQFLDKYAADAPRPKRFNTLYARPEPVIIAPEFFDLSFKFPEPGRLMPRLFDDKRQHIA